MVVIDGPGDVFFEDLAKLIEISFDFGFWDISNGIPAQVFESILDWLVGISLEIDPGFGFDKSQVRFIDRTVIG